MEDNSPEEFKSKVASGVIVFAVRKVFHQGILTVSNIILARIFTPEIFGTFGIISYLILTAGILTNFGLEPALVQKKNKLHIAELRVVFTILLIASLAFSLIVYFLAPQVDVFYKGQLGPTGIFWLRVFSLTQIIGHMTTISMRLLERELDFTRLTIGSLITVATIQITSIIFAMKGFGVGSFVLGNLVGNVISFFVFFYLHPWEIGLSFKFKKIKKFLGFGLNYQAKSLVEAANGAVVPVFIGSFSGPAAVGLINWAGGVRQGGFAPFEIVEKVIFPAASRLQGQKKLLASLIEKTIKISSMLSFPLIAFIFALAPQIIYIIYTSKWLAGLTALYLSLIQGIFILLGVIFMDILTSLGQTKEIRNISIFWAALQWILTIPLVIFWNFNGVVLAGLIVSSTVFIPFRWLRKRVKFDVKPFVLPYLLYSIFSGLAVFSLSKVFVITSLWQLILMGLVGATIYVILLALFEGAQILKDVIRFRELIFNAKNKV